MKGFETYLAICIVLIAAGCADESVDDANNLGDVVDTGVDAEIDPGTDAEMEDPCQPSVQFWNLTEERFVGDEGISEYEGTVAAEEAGPEKTGAVVRNGELIIRTEDEEMPPVGFVRMNLGLRPISGDLPGTHEFTEVSQDIDPLDDFPQWWEGSYFYYSVITGYIGDLPTSTGAMVVKGGTVTLDTCPNEVGQWAIGSIDATIGQVFDEGTMEGDFAIIVYESDGSLDCAEPTICDY